MNKPTDSELLDGLQRLFDTVPVIVLRTCRSGVKIEACSTSMVFSVEPASPDTPVRSYFGGSPGAESTYNAHGLFGADIRTAITRALEGEGE